MPRPSRPLALSLAALGLAALAAPALAQTSQVTVTGTGTVTMSAPNVGDFTGVGLSSTAVTTTAAVGSFTVTDTSVPSTGWKVQVGATLFCTGASLGSTTSCPSDSSSLPAGSLSHGVPSSVTAAGANGLNVPPVVQPASGIDGSSGKTIVSAGTTTSGNWTVGTSTLTLSVPPSAVPGIYTSKLTYTVTQGP